MRSAQRYRTAMASDELAGILDLDVEDRILIVEEIWDSIANEPDAVPVTAAQRAELDRRLLEVGSDGATVRWDEVRRRLLEVR